MAEAELCCESCGSDDSALCTLTWGPYNQPCGQWFCPKCYGEHRVNDHLERVLCDNCQCMKLHEDMASCGQCWHCACAIDTKGQRVTREAFRAYKAKWA
jgi:hypothetical protein